jgi:uncharacterized repeat protein (TIGR03803 family)
VYEMSISGGIATETVLWNFDDVSGTDAENPYAGLVRDSSGNLYGTTIAGGTHNAGTVFEITSSGVESVLWNFGGTGDGSTPYAKLYRDSSGNLYGTTDYGGIYGEGTVFELSKSAGVWVELRLYSFGGTGDGAYPLAGLIADSSGNLYGTTYNGGAYANGTVFKLAPTVGTWNESWLYSFVGASTGWEPYGGLFKDSSGNLYGTTERGGASGYGTVFEIVP